jgi:hypothetical protein
MSDMRTVISWMRDALRGYTSTEIIMRLLVQQVGYAQCVCIAMLVEAVDGEYSLLQGLTSASVVFTSLSGIVVVSWVGYLGIYYYIIPVVILWFLFFIGSQPWEVDRSLSTADIDLLGIILASRADFILYFYSILCLRSLLPDMVCRASLNRGYHFQALGCFDENALSVVAVEVLLSALRHLRWSELRSLLLPSRITIFQHLAIYAQMPDELYASLLCNSSQQMRRMNLVIAIVVDERYPSSQHSFALRRWKARIVTPLRELHVKGMYGVLPKAWVSPVWESTLAGCSIPFPHLHALSGDESEWYVDDVVSEPNLERR